MPSRLTRRALGRGLAVLVGGAAIAPIVAACGSAAPTATPVPAKPAEKPAAAAPTSPAAAATKPAEAPKPTEAAKPAPAAAPAGTKQVQGEFVLSAVSDTEAYKKWAEAFLRDKYPGLKVRFDITPWGEYWTKLQTVFAANEQIDLMMNHDSRAQAFAARGVLQPVDDFKKAMPLLVPESELWTDSLPYLSWKGKLYAWPCLFATYGLVYNKTLFQKAGVPVPNDQLTWEGLAEVGQKLRMDTNADGKPDTWGWASWGHLDNIGYWTTTVNAYGGDHFNKDVTKATINEAGGVAGLQAMQDFWVKHKVAPNPAALQQLGGNIDGIVRQGLGATAYIYVGHMDVMQENAKKNNFEWGVALPPAGPQGRFMRVGGSSWSVPKTAKHAEPAWDWARHQVSHVATVNEIATELKMAVAHLPTYEKTLAPKGEVATMLGESWKKVFVDGALKYGKALNYSHVGVEYTTMAAAELAPLADGSKSAKEVSEAIASKGNKLLAEAKTI